MYMATTDHRTHTKPTRLRLARIEIGMNLGDAKDAGIDPSQLSRVERGLAWLGPRQLMALAELYERSPGDVAELVLEAMGLLKRDAA